MNRRETIIASVLAFFDLGAAKANLTRPNVKAGRCCPATLCLALLPATIPWLLSHRGLECEFETFLGPKPTIFGENVATTWQVLLYCWKRDF